MAIFGKQDKKVGLAREYEVIWFGDKYTARSKSLEPVFIKILKRTLAKLGGLKKLGTIPGTQYQTPAGLKVRYHRDADGLVWRNSSGTVKGVNYAATTVVDPELQDNYLVLTTNVKRKVSEQQKKIGQTATGGTRALKNIPITSEYSKITIGLPASVTTKDVAAFVLDKFGTKGDKILAWKYGGIVESFQGKAVIKEKKDSVANIDAIVFSPVGVVLDGNLTKSNTINKNSSKTITYAILREKAVALMGFKNPVESTSKAILTGTRYGTSTTKSGTKGTSFEVFAKPEIFTQVWSTAQEGSKNQTANSNPGTGITVRARYTKRLNTVGIAPARTGKIKTDNEYAFFNVPAGTPKGMIAEYLMRVPKRPRSFQIAKGSSSHFGTSTALPTRSNSSSATTA